MGHHTYHLLLNDLEKYVSTCNQRDNKEGILKPEQIMKLSPR